MEFVKFVLCMSIIALANAAALTKSNKVYKFEVPELGHEGFEMTLKATINKKAEAELDKRALGVQFKIDEGLHINIIQEEEEEAISVKSRMGENLLNTVTLRLNVTKDDETKKLLRLQVFLSDGFQNEEIATFNKLRHVSVGGVIEHIDRLCFNFTDETVPCQ